VIIQRILETSVLYAVSRQVKAFIAGKLWQMREVSFFRSKKEDAAFFHVNIYSFEAFANVESGGSYRTYWKVSDQRFAERSDTWFFRLL
jgi:hypothetical protein